MGDRPAVTTKKQPLRSTLIDLRPDLAYFSSTVVGSYHLIRVLASTT